jgi:uncharacterized protein (TIGR02265 family)
MADEFLVFEQTVEALLRASEGRLSAAAKARLRAAGLDVERRLKPSYPFHTWMEFIRIVAEELYPGEPLEQAALRVGEAYVAGFRQTMLGRGVLSMLRVLGPRRTMHRATQTFRAGNNYTESRLRELGPTHVELWMNEVGPLPTFTAGIIRAGLKAAGAQEVEVRLAAHDGHAATYRIRWSDRPAASSASARQ